MLPTCRATRRHAVPQPANSAGRCESVDRAVLDRLFCCEREAGLDFVFCCLGFGYAGRYVFSQRWTVLEAVAGAAAYQPDVVELRMAINQEISVRGVFVLTDAHFDYRCVLQSREATRDECSRGVQRFRAGDARLRVGINARAV